MENLRPIGRIAATSKGFNTARPAWKELGLCRALEVLTERRVMRELKIRDQNYPNWKLRIPDDGRVVTWEGVERGPLSLHYENTQYIVLKEAGHQWYYNQYNGQQYEPAKFIVFKKWDAPSTTELQQVLEFYIRADLSFLKT